MLAFLLDYLTANTTEELLPKNLDSRSVLGLPVLGTIPVLKNPLHSPGSLEAENIRQLRTNILLSPSSHPLKTLLIASPQPGDGKTVTTANLGAGIADGKSKVVLVDADLRNPSLHEIFDQPNLCGVADLLSADESMLGQLIPQYLRSTHIPGLALLCAGKVPQDPSALLSSRSMMLICEELSKSFDFIIVDSPPFVVAPDATLLSKLADGILLVVYPGKTGLKAAEETIDSFRSMELNLLGVTVNHTSPAQSYYQYYTPGKPKTGLPERVWESLSFLKTRFDKTPLDPELISLDEAARMLSVQRRTVEQWCQKGQLNARRINWQWWVKRADLQDFLKNRFGIEMQPNN